MLGEEIFSKRYPNITIQKGRNVIDIDEVNLSIEEAGFYVFEYKVIKSGIKQ